MLHWHILRSVYKLRQVIQEAQNDGNKRGSMVLAYSWKEYVGYNARSGFRTHLPPAMTQHCTRQNPAVESAR